MADGPEHRARDAQIVNPVEFSDKWVNSEWQDFMWKTDVMQKTKKKTTN
jgi:hypothetical protein